jgi:ribose-phosphate pyrophosphokinase
MLIFGAFEERSATLNLKTTFVFEYLPFARADREFLSGMGVPLKVFIETLKVIARPSINWTVVRFITTDVHNLEKLQTYAGATPVENSLIIPSIRHYVTEDTVFLAPDKGAFARVEAYAKRFERPGYHATKERHVASGKILSTQLERPEVFQDKTVIIVDDICDGGGTFLPLAELLYASGASKVILAVSHMIGSKGISLFEENGIQVVYKNQICKYF